MKGSSAVFAVIAVVVVSAQAWAAGSAPARLSLGEKYSFVFISDSRSGDRVYSKIVNALVKRNPDFVVFGGDILPKMRNEDHWNNFLKLSAPIEVPFYLAPGNHDIEDEKSEEFWRKHVDLPGLETYYSFTVGDDLFVVLNSVESKSDRMITGEQLGWLRRTLDPGKYEHQFVFVHHPLFMWKGAFHEKESLDRHPAERDDLHRLFVEKKVDIVFHGHEHGYRRMDKDGVRYIIGAGAGSPLYSKSFHHFILVNIDDTLIRAKVVDKEGVLRDEFTMGSLPNKDER
ncbi:MAG: metallophosphoesterase [Candidatus Portnoybacteria bacterium]|nr:metallophosphoesterase [Candidatus Portnoybacteria bacterium]